MKFRLTLILLCFTLFSFSQQKQNKQSTIDFVEVLNNNTKEALFYYQNNWKVLREIAIKKGYIHSFQIMETTFTEEAPYHFILVTTYESKTQYDKRETHFQEIIKTQDGLKLLNDKKPGDFRKVVTRTNVIKYHN